MGFRNFSLGFEFKELKKFENLDMKEKRIVFYSENENSFFIYESLINELTNIHNLNICYVTSSKEESILKTKNEKIHTFYIGDGIARTNFFLNLKANILIMTMPDLETYHIKRSKIFPVHYVYIFHSMLSTHMVYKKKAFDNFDTILCVGSYQMDEIRSTEKLYNLKPKKLIQFGYSHLDNLIEKYGFQKNNIKKDGTIKILIAPGWGGKGIFDLHLEKILDILLQNRKYKIIVRPHPMTQKKFKKKISNLEKKYVANSQFVLELNITNFDSFLDSDIMITDWSGVALEFAFTFERPILYVDVPKKIHNKEFVEIPHIPIEENIRNKIGTIMTIHDLENIVEKVEELNKKSEIMKNQIKKIRENTVFNIGKSSAIGANQIIELLNNLENYTSEKQ